MRGHYNAHYTSQRRSGVVPFAKSRHASAVFRSVGSQVDVVLDYCVHGVEGDGASDVSDAEDGVRRLTGKSTFAIAASFWAPLAR